MERFSTEQRVLIVKTFYQNGESFAATVRRLRAILGRNHAPNESTVRRLMKKINERGSTANIKNSGRPRSGRSVENIALVRESVNGSPQKSVRRRSQQLGIRYSSLQRILVRDLHYHPYKIQFTQELKMLDHQKRLDFVDWVLRRQQEDDGFARKVIFSDEAHFHLNGYVNKQNCRIWGSENPHSFHEREMHPQRVTVWCGFWAGGVIGPYFFENEAGQAVTVNGDRYRTMIRDFLWPHFDAMDIQQLWFQQDGATCHTSGETIALLHEKFPDRLISLHGDQQWPPRSCDLTPCDFFLWGYVKSLVYANNPQNTRALKDEIRQVLGEIGMPVCESVINNFRKRVLACQQSGGGHMPDLIFHT